MVQILKQEYIQRKICWQKHMLPYMDSRKVSFVSISVV